MRNGPLVVVGDTLLDLDVHGTVGRVAPDAPVPVVDCQRERHRAGGAGLAGAGLAGAARDAAALSRAWGSAVAVTLGEGGALLHTGEAVPMLAPAEAIHGPHDSCGAGDCFAAAAAQVLRSGGLLSEAVTEAVRQATDFVRQGGASASPGATIPPEASPVRAIPPPDAGADAGAWRMVAEVRARGGRVVATGGCFDLLHAGHVGLLREARRLGDCLVVCLNSDASVRALKGPGRPLVAAEDRARILAALECVDAVVVFGEQDPAAVLERLRPDVWVKGGDYAPDDLTEAAVVRRHGGEVVLLPYLIRHSTTDLVIAAQRKVAS